MCPLEYHTLKRKITNKKDARSVYLLYEGKNTEPLFIAPFIENSNYIDSREIRFIQFEKTDSDVGVTNLPQLIKLAKKFKQNSTFRKGYDKIIIFFDLDVYKNNQSAINKIMNLIDDDIILAYTNPSIELFLLLTYPRTYETIIEPKAKEILKNDFVGKKRYINNLFTDYSKINSKSSDGQVSLLSENFETAISQERMFLNQFIDLASTKLTSNIGYIFEKLKKSEFDINYYSPKYKK